MSVSAQLENIAKGLDKALGVELLAIGGYTLVSPKGVKMLQELRRAVTADIRKAARDISLIEQRQASDAALIEQVVGAI